MMVFTNQKGRNVFGLGISILCLWLMPLDALIAQSVIRGPYLQTGTPTSIRVKWRTSSSTDSKVFYGTSLQALNQSVTNGTSKTNHELTISNLSPNTQYYYAVGNQGGIIEGGTADYHFITSPPENTQQNIRAWVLGDCGTANSNQEAVRDAFLTYNGGQHLDMTLLLGDNAYNTGTDSEYQDAIFDMYTETLQKSVFWSCPGNHDYYTISSYLSIFSNPTGGEAGGVASGTERYYSYNYGNVHFLSLDSHGSSRNVGGSMYNWIQNDLNNVTQDWIVAFWHHPPYTKGSHDSDTESRLIEMRENILPLLESHGVDLILSGHSHSYERSYLVNGHYGHSSSLNPGTMILDNGDGDVAGDGAYQKDVTGPNAGKGAVYIVAGSSGKISGVNQHPVMYTWQNKLGSVLLDINAGSLNVKFIDDNGNVDDEFTIEKELDNEAPIAVNDTETTYQTTTVEVDVLANDSDPNGQLDASSVAIVTAPSNGGTSINGTTGAISYTPNPGFLGNEVFEYSVCDDGVPSPTLCDTASVTVTVQLNLPPVANNDTETTNENTPVTVDVLNNDNDPEGNLDPSTVNIVVGPLHGAAVVNPSGTITYTPNFGQTGPDDFSYEVNDGFGNTSNTALVTITTLPNLPPVASDDSEETTDGTAVLVSVLDNDSDPNNDLDGSSISTAGLLQPSHGTTVVQPSVGIEYTPTAGYTGYDQFEYSVCDNSNPTPLCDVAVVTVLVDCGAVAGYNLIKGKVFEDTNQDQINLNENGQQGVTVSLYNDNNENGVLDAGDTFEDDDVTDADGEYSFAVTPVYSTTGSITVAVSQDSDDAWEKDNGDVENDKDEHEMGKNEKHIGLRFQNLNIPDNAVITNAYISFVASNNETKNPSGISIYTELNTAPATFAEQDYNLTNRTPSLSSVSWTFNNWSEDDVYQSPNIAAVIQEVVDLGTWNAGDDLVILADGVEIEKRKFYAHDKDPGLAPTLHVDYEVPGQDDFYYVMELDMATLPPSSLLTTDNIEAAVFSAEGETDCLNDFGFLPGVPPVVDITSPTDGAVFVAVQNVSIEANAFDSDGTVTSVEFFVNGNSIGTDNSAPYTATYALNLNGAYTLTALVTDNDGFTTLSDEVDISLAVPNVLPTISITNPADGTIYTSIQVVDIDATASDSDGTVTQVDFYLDGNLLSSDMTAPYEASINLNTEGTYQLQAVATDNLGESSSSTIVSITLDLPNDPPTVSITDPVDGHTFLGPQTITITASAADPDGTIDHVDFYVDNTLVGSDNTAPYTYDHALSSDGFYTLEAEAFDNNMASTLSAPVTVEMMSLPTTETFLVQDEDDDAREKNNGDVQVDQDRHELGKEGYIGIRFQNVSIPAGAVISSAKLIFKSENHEDKQPCSVDIYGESNPNPAIFVEDDYSISSRDHTTNSVSWTPGEWTKNDLFDSPDLTSIIQELVNDQNWASGNAMAILLEATGNERRKGFAFEKGQAKAPKLEITYFGAGNQPFATNGKTPKVENAEAKRTKALSVDVLNIYPNPARGEVTLELNSPADQALQIRLYDQAYRLIQSGKYQVKAGPNTIKYGIESYAEGMHFLSIINAEMSVLRKLVLIK